MQRKMWRCMCLANSLSCIDFCKCEDCNNNKQADENDCDDSVEEEEYVLWLRLLWRFRMLIYLIDSFNFLGFFFFFFFMFVLFLFLLFLIIFKLSHIWVCYNICKLLKNYHHERRYSEIIASFLLASSQNKFVKWFSYRAFTALMHSTLVSFNIYNKQSSIFFQSFSQIQQNRTDEGVSA